MTVLRAPCGTILANGEAAAVSTLALGLATATVGATRLPAGLAGPEATALATAVGARVADDGAGWTIMTGRGIGGLTEPDAPLAVTNGAAMAVLCGLLAGHPLTAVIDGAVPPDGLGALLTDAGATVLAAGDGTRAPITLRGRAGLSAISASEDPAAEPWTLALARLSAGLAAPGTTAACLPPVLAAVVVDLLRAFAVPCEAAPAGALIRLTVTGEAETTPAALPADWPAVPAWMAARRAGEAPVVMAIDGPAAAGKGTLARGMAERLGLAYLDTGLLYRATGMAVRRAGGNPDDPAAAEQAARALRPSDLAAPDLRGEAAGDAASRVASMEPVRAALLDFQRSFAHTPPDGAPGAVLDGRDIGTVVCPDADVKLFVTARPETRARRRFMELRERGQDVIESRVLQDMKDRDARDSSRGIAPLVAADDAVVLDTSDLDRDGALAASLALVAACPRLNREAASG
jgi:cytidylate kinase